MKKLQRIDPGLFTIWGCLMLATIGLAIYIAYHASHFIYFSFIR